MYSRKDRGMTKSMTEKFNIRNMLLSDLNAVVSIHMISFPSFFLTFLGKNFLTILYKATIVLDIGITKVVVDSEGNIAGFVSGTTQQSGFYSCLLKKYFFAFAIASLRGVLCKPKIVFRLIRSFKKSADAKTSVAEASLMSIAVNPKFQGYGLGKQLVNAFSDAIKQQNIYEYCLTTDLFNNDSVNNFYKSCGFELARQFTTHEGRKMNEYLMRLT